MLLRIGCCLFAVVFGVCDICAQVGPGPGESPCPMVCPMICAVDNNERISCGDLYGPWGSYPSFGCTDVQACVGMECSGWSIRVDKVGAAPEAVWNIGYLVAEPVEEGLGWWTDCPNEHVCYEQVPCKPACEWDEDLEVWVCVGDPFDGIGKSVMEDVLTVEDCFVFP